MSLPRNAQPRCAWPRPQRAPHHLGAESRLGLSVPAYARGGRLNIEGDCPHDAVACQCAPERDVAASLELVRAEPIRLASKHSHFTASAKRFARSTVGPALRNGDPGSFVLAMEAVPIEQSDAAWRSAPGKVTTCMPT